MTYLADGAVTVWLRRVAAVFVLVLGVLNYIAFGLESASLGLAT